MVIDITHHYLLDDKKVNEDINKVRLIGHHYDEGSKRSYLAESKAVFTRDEAEAKREEFRKQFEERIKMSNQLFILDV